MSCEDIEQFTNQYKDNKLYAWIGNNSEISKILVKSKCILDKQLISLTPNKKKLIAKLLAESYEYEIDKNERYNF